jgi:two-component system, chemotaxis family, CheB/CheR fusion protein
MPEISKQSVTTNDFAHQLEYEDLVKDARAVMANLTPVRREIHSRKGHW